MSGMEGAGVKREERKGGENGPFMCIHPDCVWSAAFIWMSSMPSARPEVTASWRRGRNAAG